MAYGLSNRFFKKVRIASDWFCHRILHRREVWQVRVENRKQNKKTTDPGGDNRNQNSPIKYLFHPLRDSFQHIGQNRSSKVDHVAQNKVA